MAVFTNARQKQLELIQSSKNMQLEKHAHAISCATGTSLMVWFHFGFMAALQAGTPRWRGGPWDQKQT